MVRLSNMEPVLRTWVISEASAFLKANDVPWPTDMVGDSARLVTRRRSWVPRENLETARSETPLLVVVQRVMKGCHSPWQGKRWVEHGTSGEVRLQNRSLVAVPIVVRVFAVLVVVAKGPMT